MERGLWRIHLTKDAHKFSSTHLTIFPDGTKERLHGHNYQVSLTVELTDASFEKMLPFSVLKGVLRAVCDELDERVLIAGENPFVERKETNGEFEFIICGARYVFPSTEVIVLPIKNVTVELLAKEIADRIVTRLDKPNEIPAAARGLIRGLEVRIEETQGQAASYVLQKDSNRV